MTALLVFLGGAVGAVVRYGVERAVRSRRPSVFPWGTFVVNIAGSLLLGFLFGLSVHAAHWVHLLVGTGFCGALTTFSTFGFETLRLVEDGAYAEAGLNVVASLLVGLGAAVGGFALAATLA